MYDGIAETNSMSTCNSPQPVQPLEMSELVARFDWAVDAPWARRFVA